MTVLIYFVCVLGGAFIQTLLRSLLNSGALPFIPGNLIIYLVAFWVARKWSNSYKENKEMKKDRTRLLLNKRLTLLMSKNKNSKRDGGLG